MRNRGRCWILSAKIRFVLSGLWARERRIWVRDWLVLLLVDAMIGYALGSHRYRMASHFLPARRGQ